MLVLTRKTSETIHIGDEITIKVIRTGRGMVRLGIEAPKHVRVRRAEVAEDRVMRPAESDCENWVSARPAGAGMSC